MLDSKEVQKNKLADAGEVAKAGYEALMKGSDKVVAGFKNKMMVAMAGVTPDEMLAHKMEKQQAPVK
jgi:short-subunit dehydrogenase